MWFSNVKEKTKQNQKTPAPEPFSKCPDSQVHGNATAAKCELVSDLWKWWLSTLSTRAMDRASSRMLAFKAKGVRARPGLLRLRSQSFWGSRYVICKRKVGGKRKRKWGEDMA